MVHEGSCAVQRDAGRVMLDHKGLDVHLQDGSFLITLHDLTWFRIVRFHLLFRVDTDRWSGHDPRSREHD